MLIEMTVLTDKETSTLSQPGFTSSKSTIEIPEHCVKFIQS